MSQSSDSELYEQARKRVASKQGYWRMVGGFVIVFLFLTAIWWFSGKGYFWPAWAGFGMAIAAGFGAVSTFGGKDGPTDAQIRAEMNKMQGNQ